MAQILIVAHSPLASSFQVVAQHVYPDCGGSLTALDVGPDEGLESATARIRSALGAMPGAEVLILADVFGATPCNAALAAADGLRSRVVAGVNVPMLWRTLCYAGQSLDDLVHRAIAGASQGVMHVATPTPQNQSPSSASHDQVQHHHQQ
jgi:PTS system mannose-specific IIA component